MPSTTKTSAKKTKTKAGMPRFDVDTLRDVAGEKVFARGAAYHQDKQVEIIAIEKTRVLARVLGSEIYRSELKVAGSNFSGECSCPAFSDRGFCKHLVATALAANDVEHSLLDEAANRFTRIRDHLRAKGIEALVEMIVGFSERDPGLLEELELSVATEADDNKMLLARFRQAIADATRTGDFVDYGKARAWAEGVEVILDRIENLIDRDRATVVLELLDYFFARMEQALAAIDDSDGHAGGVFARACEIHLAACRKARPDPVALARDLFAREVESEWDFFHAAGETYGDVLGKAGLAEYRRLAAEEWQKIKPLRGGDRRAHDDQFTARYRLGAILESFAERDGDVDARIAIRAKDLSSAYDYLGIAELCLDHGREEEALKWTKEGLWQFEDQPDERLIFFASDLYKRAGREDADSLLWQAFDRLPSIELYRRLKATAGTDRAAGVAVRDRSLALLRAQISKPGRQAVARWSSPTELLLRLMITEGLFAEAWEVVRVHGCSDGIVESLAEASEATHPGEALKVYARRVERLVGLGGQGNYEDACRIIARMQLVRERLCKKADHAAYLDELMTRHKAKRNFMKLLRAR